MKRNALFLTLIILAPVAVSEDALLGFAEGRATPQRELEAKFDESLSKDNLREWMQQMTVRPHHVGAPQTKANAEFIAEQFRGWGFDTEIEVFHVLFPTPRTRELALVAPERVQLNVDETIAESDSASAALKEEGLPPFNAYSADGDVTGDLVYVHHGVPEDYEELARRGIDVKGKIVIARYGGSWRGIKPKVAAERGAIGCLIYNDPGDDGFAEGDAYPDGAFKHETAVQRGSIVDLPLRPGDPLTPNYGATEDAKRLAVAESETIMKIPTLPISYATARQLFAAMTGPLAPSAWRGGMPLTYRLGGDGSARVHLKVAFNWDIRPAYNVIAKLEGSVYPDQWIIRGNHHDAWVIGARDPISGMVTVMEEARAVGELAQDGWRPKRTLVYCAWDAEEPGLLGSTEWVEHHREELREKAVAYINTDGNSRGFLRVGGSHALETLAQEVAAEVIDPQTKVSVAERVRAATLTRGSGEAKKRAKESKSISLYALGSGSDYSAFLQHLGIASFNVGFGGEGNGGEYHTSIDTFDHYSKFIDPTFDYGIALTQVCGRLTLRLANADVLPFDFTGTAKAVESYVDEVIKLADTLREETREENDRIADGLYALADDPTEAWVAPERKSEVPYFNFAPLQNALAKLTDAAAAYEKAFDPGAGSAALDRTLYQSERAFTNPNGLPRRPWFRHQIYAPGFYTGYGVKTLPGVREGIEERNWTEAEAQIVITANAIERFAEAVQRAADLIQPR